jgi:ABC-type Zn2+ transport system substrate-binding protein/surface adhesin
MALTKEQRRSLVANIVAQIPTFEEDSLTSLTDNQLVALAKPNDLDSLVNNAAKMAAKMEDEDEDDEDDEELVVAKGKKVYNEADDEMVAAKGKKGKMTSNRKWWNDAPPEVKRLVANAQRVEKRRREELVAAITANGNCPLTADDLNARSTEDLETFAAMAQGSVAANQADEPWAFDFSGLGEPLAANASTVAVKALGLPGADYMNKA